MIRILDGEWFIEDEIDEAARRDHDEMQAVSRQLREMAR